MSTRVLLVRHGETHGNINNLFCGHSETELTPLGEAQAQRLARRLKSERIDAAYASDLSRAHRTAQIALEHHTLQIALDPALREMHYGEWEGLPGSLIREQHPELFRQFLACTAAAPGGETVQQIRQRTATAVRDLVARHQGETLALFSHGNAIMAMVAEFLDLPIERSWSFSVHNTSVTRLHFNRAGRVTVQALNDASHLEDLA